MVIKESHADRVEHNNEYYEGVEVLVRFYLYGNLPAFVGVSQFAT
jgi:hypothetical protein